MGISDKDSDKSERLFWTLLIFFIVASILRFFERTITEYNTTLFAMSYHYGFISRGFIGTLYAGLDRITAWDIMTYRHIYIFTMIMTLVLFIVILMMYRSILSRCSAANRVIVKYLLIFLSIFLFPMFLTEEVFGRLDLYLYILTFIGIILLLEERAEWLITPIVAICMCIHQGYVLTCANMIFVLLIYRCLTETGSRRRKYAGLFISSAVVVLALFVYFEFFSHVNATAYADEIISAAKALSYDGKSYNTSIIDHEILGLDVYGAEWKERQVNRKEFPFFLICFIPYILLAIYYFGNLMKKTYFVRAGEHPLTEADRVSRGRAVGRVLYVLGGLSVVPQMILKVDYGRYVFMTFTYYILMTICLIVLSDDATLSEVSDTARLIKEKCAFPLIVFIYPMLFMPLHDVVISGASYRVATWFDWLR